MVSEQAVISITEEAARRARGILEKSGKQEASIRISAKSAGCSGYQYGMSVDESDTEGDSVVEMHGVRLVVDRVSLPLLAGSVVGWRDSMVGGGFSVENPNAGSSCGCGHSSHTEEDAPPSGGSSCH